MSNQLRTYRLFGVGKLLASNRLYPTDVVEKAIAQCKKPFYVHYDVAAFNRKTGLPSYESLCGLVQRMWIEKDFLVVTFRTAHNPATAPDLWDREPDSLSILPIAEGVLAKDNETVIKLDMFSLAISKTNKNQFSKFIKKSRIIHDPMIRI